MRPFRAAGDPTSPAHDLAGYIADNYGRCRVEPCRCLRPGSTWLGRACPNWKPVKARTWDELRDEQRRFAASIQGGAR